MIAAVGLEDSFKAPRLEGTVNTLGITSQTGSVTHMAAIYRIATSRVSSQNTSNARPN